MMRQRVEAGRLELTEARLIVLFGCAQLLDVGTTILGLRSHLLHEGNPIASLLLGQGANLALALKLLVGMTVILVLHRYVSPGRRRWVMPLIVLVALIAPAINGYELLHARHLYHL
jgi:hypothetical protein